MTEISPPNEQSSVAKKPDTTPATPMAQLLELMSRYGGVDQIPSDKLEEIGYEVVRAEDGSLKARRKSVPAVVAKTEPIESKQVLTPEQTEKRRTPLALLWPDDTDKIATLFSEVKKQPDVLYRTITRLPVRTHQTSGRPVLPRSQLPSHAYELGGWRQVASIVEQRHGSGQSLEELVSEVDMKWQNDELTPAPVVWTSEDPRDALGFKTGGDDNDFDVFLIITPDQDRKTIHYGDEHAMDDLLSAVKSKNPFRIEMHNEPIYEGDPYLEETLLGPYIARTELSAMVRIPREHHDKFTKFLCEKLSISAIKI